MVSGELVIGGHLCKHLNSTPFYTTAECPCDLILTTLSRERDGYGVVYSPSRLVFWLFAV